MKTLTFLFAVLFIAPLANAKEPKCVRNLKKQRNSLIYFKVEIVFGYCEVQGMPLGNGFYSSAFEVCNDSDMERKKKAYNRDVDDFNKKIEKCRTKEKGKADQYLSRILPFSHYVEPDPAQVRKDCERLMSVDKSRGYEILRQFESWKNNPRIQSISKDDKKKFERDPRGTRSHASEAVWSKYRDDADIADLRTRIEYGEITIGRCQDVMSPSGGASAGAPSGDGSDR